ncbi:heparan-alpha-glucosaminide N-acetyltransferase domain-containing protein [Cellulomonas endophytica]|uniref:heparan-alpha-glucosaminide N-acetyltransferase domain-containing protein n=1 Tax=Cellulomonas endophytica TaxID=2494735 RepID=UPI00101231EE|nr:heparan-alpha-glucosaminide N-acetyltransferase domain-containing protein [Cellulomonas endophytica]
MAAHPSAAPAPGPAPRPVPPSAPAPAAGRSDDAPGRRRLVGIDLARGVAVLGMVTAHVGPDEGRVLPRLLEVADGRSAALFVVLAGVGLALLSGGDRPATGVDLVRARVRVLARAALLVPLGALLALLGTPVVVILLTYGALFVVGAAALRLPRVALLVLAGAAALGGPVLHALLAPLSDATGSPETLWDVLVGPYYPAVVWVAYLLVGLALGRGDLRSPGTRGRLALLGAGLVVLGHGGSWVAEHVLGLPGVLVTTEPHSATTFEVVGNTGSALLVLAACLVVAERLPRPVAPVVATGALSLTAYSGHLVVLALLGTDAVWDPTTGTWLALALGVVLVCWAWHAALGRGPLEALLHRVSLRAADVTDRRGPRTPAPLPTLER